MTKDQKEVLPQDRRISLEVNTGTWKALTIAQALDRATQKYADSPLVMTDQHKWSYREIQQASSKLAARLIENGVGQGDHVGIWLANYAEFVVAKFAIARAGAVAVPINFSLRQTELSYILEQAECVTLITMDVFREHDYLADLDAIMPGWESAGGGSFFPRLHTVMVRFSTQSPRVGALPLIDADWVPSPENLVILADREEQADPHSLSDIIYTSGTTGHPKGAMVTHDMVLRTGYSSAYCMAREEGRRVLFALPMYHVFGYVECLIACLFYGGAIVPRISYDAEDMLDAAERFEVGEMTAVPLMTIEMLALARKRGFNCPSLVAFFNSGGVSPPTIWQDIRDVFGARELLTGYGMTETTASACCCLPEGENIYLLTTNGKLKDAGVAGIKELGGKLAIYKAISSETGEDLPYGEKGELLVKGYSVTRGYFKKPEENARAFTKYSWLHTGDVGTVSADGYVQLLGRIKEAYRCGGEMVMPEEVEKFLETHENISDAFVVGVPDDRMGEAGCVFIVADGGCPTVEEIKAFCQDSIARFKVPKYVIPTTLEDVPHTATGRARRVFLAELARDRLGLSSASE